MRTKYIDHSAPNDPTKEIELTGYQHKRGKIVRNVSRSTWDMRGGMGQAHDHEQGKRVLDETLRD